MKIALVSDTDLSFFFEWQEWFSAERIKISDNMDLAKYDLAWVYCINTDNVSRMKLWKEHFPSVKFVMMTDSDFWWNACPWISEDANSINQETLNGLRSADLVYCINVATKKLYDSQGIKSVLDFPMSRLPFQLPQLNYEERKNRMKAAIMCHSMPRYSPRSNVMIAQELKMKPVIFGTFQNMTILRNVSGNVEAEYYERITDITTYTNKLNECFLGLEDWYAGGSRFVIECAVLGIPVVGSENILSLQILSPELTCPNGDVKLLVQKARTLIDNEWLYRVLSKRIQEKALSYFSPEETKKRLFETISKRLNIPLTIN